MQHTDPRQNSGSSGAKNVSDALDNDTKANLPENVPGKMRFQKKRGHGSHASLFRRGPNINICYSRKKQTTL